MAQGVVFRVLGPLEVVWGARAVRIPAGKQRTLLASLLLSPNDVVPMEDLVGLLWDDGLPDSPRAALHTCLTRLRTTLGRHEEGLSGLIRTSAAGYVIDADAASLDLLRFRAHVASSHAAAAACDDAAEAAALVEALSLWRGPVLPDVRSASLHHDVVPRVTEEWLRARERCHELDLARGRHDELVGELRVLIRRYPFHERFWHQLILSLYRCGRRVEALQAFRDVSVRLRDEMGMDPSEQLRTLHLAILRGDPDLMGVGGRAVHRYGRFGKSAEIG
ncbi:BTAD domain-containing putative transcriptional regulator [Nocardiopsis mangrovi]|uniref:BTAD domain-containing putative transcriptional regulator n=1 Tax=Nocardiopsis mangrovi TaxID=1179818 RepID=A0ABV9DQL3_9ACTN